MRAHKTVANRGIEVPFKPVKALDACEATTLGFAIGQISLQGNGMTDIWNCCQNGDIALQINQLN
jgi:hypothetical protein